MQSAFHFPNLFAAFSPAAVANVVTVGIWRLIMTLAEIERIAKEAAMKSGEDWVVLERDAGYSIQPTSKPIPKDAKEVSRMSGLIDLLR